jgi:uncharacterized RDD family membrane protein YckC
MIEGPVNTISVRTPEGVAFSFRLASPAIRLAAMVIDLGVIASAGSIVTTLARIIAPLSEDVAGLAAVIGYFVLSEGYRIFIEWKWRGQTIGKRLLRLRVVDAQGKRLAFEQVAMRNLLRFVDALPVAYLVGGSAAFLSRRGQRLGDLAAGTLVIWEPEQKMPEFESLRGDKYNSLRAQLPIVARIRQAVGPEVAQVAWQALARRNELEAGARLALFADLASYIRSVTRIPEDVGEGVPDEQFVRNVVDVLYVTRG